MHLVELNSFIFHALISFTIIQLYYLHALIWPVRTFLIFSNYLTQVSKNKYINQFKKKLFFCCFQMLDKGITLSAGMTLLCSPLLLQLSGSHWKKLQSFILKYHPTICLFNQISKQMCTDELSFEWDACARPWRTGMHFGQAGIEVSSKLRCNITLYGTELILIP